MIVTHTNPDLDAITGVWLLMRHYGYPDEIQFINTGNPDPELLAKARVVVDTGKVYDPHRLRFDHHQLPGELANETCATKQVFEYLLSLNSKIEYLRPLINLVFAGDTGRPEANQSRELGLHALFSAWKTSHEESYAKFDDMACLIYGFSLLDLLELRLRKQAEAKAELTEKTVWKSADGKVWAIRHGSIGSSFAAAEEGAVLVVFEGEPIEKDGEIISYPIGISRLGGAEVTEPHIGQLVKTVLKDNYTVEMASWFCHPAGFFAGRGTGKAPDPTLVEIDIALIAQMIDQVWDR